jgi:hypothetical protein
VIDGVSIPHYRIVCVAPVDDAAPVLSINFIMTSITELDVRIDVIDGCSIISSRESW